MKVRTLGAGGTHLGQPSSRGPIIYSTNCSMTEAVTPSASASARVTMRRSIHATLDQVLQFHALVDIRFGGLGRKMTKAGVKTFAEVARATTPPVPGTLRHSFGTSRTAAPCGSL